MSDILNKVLVLSLNKNWQPIREHTVRKAIENMTSNREGEPPEYGLDMECELDADGNPIWDNITHVRPVSWEEWIALPVRPYDMAIQTGRFSIRAPTITICSKNGKLPIRAPKLGKRAILERDGFIDQYSGEKLRPSEANIDHVIPRSRGGKDVWENLVTTKKKTNFDKGNRFNHEVGLKLIRQPSRPKPMPVSFSIQSLKHPSWARFIHR